MLATSRTCVTALATLLCVCAWQTLAGDDGSSPSGKKSLGGSGEMIQLELPDGSRMLSGIEIHGSRYGTATPPEEKFLIYVLTEDMAKDMAVEMAPYSLFDRGEERWVAIKFDKPIEFPKNSWLVLDFRAGRTKGVYVSYSTGNGSKRSKVGLPGIAAKDVDFEGNWMIRPLISQ
jgi:hypothetical protein